MTTALALVSVAAHADRIAAAHAERAQRGVKPGRTLARLCPGVAAREVHDSGQVAEDLGAATKLNGLMTTKLAALRFRIWS